MVSKGLLYVAAAPLLLLSLALIGVVIALGTVGIVRAQDSNPCPRSSTAVECVGPLVSLVNQSDDQPVDPPEFDADEYAYWLAGASGCGVLWAVVHMFAVWVLFEVIRILQIIEDEEKKKKKTRLPSDSTAPLSVPTEGHEGAAVMLQGGEGREETDDDDEPAVFIDTIGKYQIQEWQRNPLRAFTPVSLITVLISNLAFIAGVLFLLWGIALGFDHARQEDPSLAAFLVVEFMVGILLPIFVFIWAALGAVVLDFITIGHLDLHKNLPTFLTALKFKEGEKNDYWVIEATFYFPLKKKTHHLEHGCFYSLDKNRSTWYLATIVALSLLLSFSYFVDISIVETITSSNCQTDFDCFRSGDFEYVDCNDTNAVMDADQFHCFRFLRFGVDVKVITAVAESFAFYLVIITFFARIFTGVKILIHIKPSRFWGILLIGLGFIIGTLIVLLVAIEDLVVIQVNVISVAQWFMVCLFLIVVGIMLVEGKWWERIPSHRVPQSLSLVNYSETSARNLREIEGKLAEEGEAGFTAGNTGSRVTNI